MNYCSIEEAWGSNNFKDSRKKKKTKRLYTTQIPPHIYDTSYQEEGHDENCQDINKKSFTVKNKNRFNKSRGTKDIFRPQRSSRANNINLRYDEAKNEYKKYKKETKRNSRNKLSRQEIVENDNYPPIFSNNNSTYIDGDEFSPIQENDMELANLPEGKNLSDTYTMNDNDDIQRKMHQLQQEQSNALKEQRNMVNQQMQNQGLVNNIEQFDNYYQDNNIEAFEGNSNELDQLNIENEEDRINEIQEVDSYAPSPQQSEINNNYVDKLMQKDTIEEDSDSENEEELEVIDEKSNDLEYRLNTLNRNVNLIIKKMNESQFFDDDSQENIHDLILFVLFGIFIIFVLDTIYRFGRQSKN